MATRSSPELEQLLVKCRAFREGTADFEDLQAALWGTAESLSGRDDRHLREFLQTAEGRVELLRFTVERARVFDEVVRVLDSVEARVRGAIEST